MHGASKAGDSMRRIANPFYRFLAGKFSPSGSDARLSILIYHRVLPQTDPLFPGEATIETFDAQMTLLKSVFNVLPLHEAAIMLKAGGLPARSACITFDDGYADNVTYALPILQKHGLHATFFIATSYLNGGRMFNDTVIESIRRTSREKLDLRDMSLGEYTLSTSTDRTAAIEQLLPKVKYLPLDIRQETVANIARRAGVNTLPDDLMMTTAQLKTLHAAGMEIGGHTHHHPILANLNDADARAEIAAGKTWLEETLGSRVRLFAYPNGKPETDYLPDQARIVRELGFDAAVSTHSGISIQASDPFQLSRFTPWSNSRYGFAAQLIQNLHGATTIYDSTRRL